MKTSMVWRIGVLGFAAGSVASVQAIDINFEELGPQGTNFVGTNPLRNEYSGIGVAFSGPSDLDGGAILHQDSNFGVPAHSGVDFLAFNSNASLANGGIPRGPETISFSGVQSLVSIWVAQAFSDATFTLDAYDSASNLVNSASVTTTNWAQLTVTGNISSVKLSYTGSLSIWDDLHTEGAVPEPATLAVLGVGALALIRRRRS